MRYLYGDSTESGLESNYLAFLRDAIDLCVELLQCDVGLAAGRERRAARERVAADAVAAIEELGRQLVRVAEPAAKAAGMESPVGRCASQVMRATADAVRSESAAVKNALAAESAEILAEAGRFGARAVTALGSLVRLHELPEAQESVSVRWTGSTYEARLRARTGFGLDVVVELDIPDASIYAHDLRVERVAEGVEIHAPEPSGWIKKEIKMVPHKVGRHHVTEVVSAPEGVTVRLRATPEAGAAGFDITVTSRGNVVRVERAGSGADAGPPFDTDDRDVGPLGALATKLADTARALRFEKRTLVTATLDGKPLSEHPSPRVLVERLVDAMSPVVRLIASHSLAPAELVLKRLLAGDRREEIFVSKAELEHKLQALPASLRQLFVPLGLGETVSGELHRAASTPDVDTALVELEEDEEEETKEK
jgi:hypothetical protein